ncbi:MAG: TetR/AcrR family transcriptional regulator [Frankia sp.]
MTPPAHRTAGRGQVSPPRQRNRRGEGALLRDDILAAAARVLGRDGVEGLSLRSVAREAGIAAPSIYAHFADRDAVLAAVMDLYFARLLATVRVAGDAHTDPVDALLASAQAYARFAAEEPAGYRALFDRTGHPAATSPSATGPSATGASATSASAAGTEAEIRATDGPDAVTDGTDGRGRTIGLDAFNHLVEKVAACVAAGRSASRDPFADTVCVWAGVHGLVMLYAGATDLPYPALAKMVEAVVRRAALIHD